MNQTILAHQSEPSVSKSRYLGTARQTDSAVSSYFQNLFQSTKGRLLDVGCGRGTLTEYNTIGMDLDIEALRLNPGLVVQADVAARLPLQDQSFSGILAKDIVEHLLNPRDFLLELRRVALYGATLVVVTPRSIGRAVWADYTHVRGFTKSALSNLLTDAGWSPVSIRRMGGLPLAGRLHLTPYLPQIMSIPGVGHYYGTNWQAIAAKSAQ